VITVVHHADDRVIVDAARVLRDLSVAGLLADLALVAVGDSQPSGQPRAACIRGGTETDMGLFDALAGSQATDGHVVTAVASADLAPGSQIELAENLARLAEQGRNLGSVPVVASCLYVPESGDGAGVLPAAGFFSERTTNFVALPTDWRFVDGMAVAIDFSDADRAAWHAALEIATLTSAWRALGDSRWRPDVVTPGVAGFSLRFVRSSARLVTVRRHDPDAADADVLPVPEGFTPAPVPEFVERTVSVLHPAAFRLDSQLGGSGGADQRGAVLRLLAGAIRGLFPPLASGLRGFWRLLRAEVVGALGGDTGSGDADEPPSQADRQAINKTAVVLEGFEPKVWTDLARNILGVADGGGTVVAAEARQAAGHKQFVFVSRDCLVDDVLELRVRGLPEDAPAAAGNPDPTGDGAEAIEGERVPVAGDAEPAGGAGDLVAGGGAPARIDPVGGAGDLVAGGGEPVRIEPAASSDRSRGLLSLIDDAFRREISKAEDRRRDQQRELEHLSEQVERTERFEPPAALRTTVAAFFATAFVVSASYVLLLDTFDFGDWSQTFRTRLAIVATAFTWLVLQYPLAPRSDDPRVVQSYLLRSAAVVAVVAALAAVFAGPISDGATEHLWLELLIPILVTAVTLWLAWKVLASERARERPGGRALGLAWTICYLVTGLLLYANMDRSVFNQWDWLRGFLEGYGDAIRWAAIAVAGFLFVLALAMLAVSDAGADRRRRRIRARMRELRWELEREELLPTLKGLRVNWLGTAAALDHILRRCFPPPSASGGGDGGLRSPLLRLALRTREAYIPPPGPGWLFAQYEAAVGAYTARRDARAGRAGWSRPETATMISRLDRDPLAVPGSDPRWDFAHRLRAGEFEDALAVGAGDGSLLDDDIEFMRQIVPVDPATLPLGLVGPGAAGLGSVEMRSTWWWPDGFGAPRSETHPRPARTLLSTAGHMHLAVRLDVSDPILENRISEVSAPPAGSAEVPAPAGPDDGLR
jgi:hypothetical protein